MTMNTRFSPSSTYFTTVNDAYLWVDSHFSFDVLSNETETHEDVCCRIGTQLWNEGHVDGLRSGDDWSNWLDTVTMDAVLDFAEHKTSQITPDN